MRGPQWATAVAQEVSDSLIVCRVYASIADMLGFMAGDVGIRAGPAANVNWRSAFSLLEVSILCLKFCSAFPPTPSLPSSLPPSLPSFVQERKLVSATKALALERNNWIKK